jgi:hypothetical protein
MPFGPRVINASGDRAEGDKLFEQSTSNVAAGSLTYGMPLSKDLTDAAEFNAKLAATALNPAAVRTGGKLVLPTSANTNVNSFAAIYQPENPSDRPAPGDIIRCLVYGEGIVSAISETANGNALKVGDVLVVKATQTSLSTAAQTPVARQSVAVVCATGAALTVGAQIAAAGSNVATLVNAFTSQT